MSQDATFMKGGNLKKVCEVTFDDGSTVRVEPYAIYTSPKHRRHYLWFRLSGSNENEEPGWRIPEASTVTLVSLTEDSFAIRKDYDPFDKTKLAQVHYSVPTYDGRQRWLDAGPDRDKQTIGNRSY